MNSINVEKMDGRKKKLYTALWKDFDFGQIDAFIINTYSPQYKKDSNNSYCFCNKGNKLEILEYIFGIDNHDLFAEKYEMAVSGSGDEEKKITTLHSSSLCALLHFYNVTEENPLIIDELETNTYKWKEVKFTKSLFEFKTPVINNPSNMDIVLIGTSEGKEVILFLESKFSEYYLYSSTVLHGISNSYRSDQYTHRIYQDEILNNMGIRISENKDNTFSLQTDDSVYLGGIKQMISHYYGLRNFIDGNSVKEPKQADVEVDIRSKIQSGATVILGEIVFDEIIGDLELRPHLKCLQSYSDMYTELAKVIGKELELEGIDTLEILKKELGYSLFKSNSHKIEANIKKFYRY